MGHLCWYIKIASHKNIEQLLPAGEGGYADMCKYYWAREASPTLGCSIEISRDIYICRFVYDSVGKSYKKNRTPKCIGGFT